MFLVTIMSQIVTINKVVLIKKCYNVIMVIRIEQY